MIRSQTLYPAELRARARNKYGKVEEWSGRRDSNPRPSPWQGDALPLSHVRKMGYVFLLDKAASSNATINNIPNKSAKIKCDSWKRGRRRKQKTLGRQGFWSPWCAWRDLNPHGFPPDPKSGASANSATRADQKATLMRPFRPGAAAVPRGPATSRTRLETWWWLGIQDSNLGMTESKSVALPLG